MWYMELSKLLNKIRSMFVCVFVMNGPENGWMDFDDYFYLLPMDTEEVIVNFCF